MCQTCDEIHKKQQLRKGSFLGIYRYGTQHVPYFSGIKDIHFLGHETTLQGPKAFEGWWVLLRGGDFSKSGLAQIWC